MTLSPGIKADAHLVARLVGGRYISWPKDVARRRVLRSLRDVSPELVIDLWGGGGSARALVAAGFHVLSVDDGRSFESFGVSQVRGRRALDVCSLEDGYDGAWGDVADEASRGDAAFLDFMGHWSPATKRTLMACRHMRAVAVTLMPERTPLGRLDEEDWLTAYKALLEEALLMKLRWVHVYRRNEHNQRATVFFLRPSGIERACRDCGASLRGRDGRVIRCPDCRKQHEYDRKHTPEYLALKVRQPSYINRDEANRKAREVRSRPEYRAEQARLEKERYATDPIYREMKKRYAREYARGIRRRSIVARPAEPSNPSEEAA